MQNSPEAIQLSKLFKEELDPQGLGFIAKQTFYDYIQKQPKKLQLYQINDIFLALKQPNKMSCQQFVMVAIGVRNNMEVIAFGRIMLQSQLNKYFGASPAGPSEVKHSHLKFQVLSKSQAVDANKKKLSITIGKDSELQNQKYQQSHKLLGRQLAELSLILKFRVYDDQQEIASKIQSLLIQAKSLGSEMLEPPLTELLDLIKFTVKGTNDYIYIFVEIASVFIDDSIRFVHQLIQSVNPSSHFDINLTIESNYLDKLLTNLNQPLEKIDDILVCLQANIDQNTMKMINQIVAKSKSPNQNMQPPQRLLSAIMLLIQSVEMDMKFKNAQSLLKDLGIESNQIDQIAQKTLGTIKTLNISELLGGFLPSFGELLPLLIKQSENHSQKPSHGEISLNLKHIFLEIDYDLSLKSLLTAL